VSSLWALRHQFLLPYRLLVASSWPVFLAGLDLTYVVPLLIELQLDVLLFQLVFTFEPVH
jgi:hypothetical protein